MELMKLFYSDITQKQKRQKTIKWYSCKMSKSMYYYIYYSKPPHTKK